ncbi:MAG: DUF192 domain-containing protein [Patescibacteria group bacterium]
MSRIFFLIIILIGISLSGCSLTARQKVAVPPAENEDASTQRVTTITLNGIPVQVEVMRTPEEKAKGFSGRAGLDEGKGMLFVFDPPSMPSFWMKEMRFSIDIIWIYHDKVIGVTPNVPAPVNEYSPLPTYSPPSLVTHVLEVPAGWAEKNEINNDVGVSGNR